MMRKKVYLLLALLLVVGSLVYLGTNGTAANPAQSSSSRPELEYLKAVNGAAPPQDPQLLFLLMGAYANANQQAEGAEFFTARLNEFGPRLTDAQRSLYLSAIGLLRGQHASSVSLLHRIGYVNDTIAIFDPAKRLSGDQLKAQDYLRQSGYENFDEPVVLTTPFSEDKLSGHAFAARRIAEIVPGRVYALSGFEFPEYYFVVSDDRRQLIGIDAGTRADSAQTAYEALRAYAPNLPELTTIFVTHSHWDHIGGQTYFRGLNPKPRFYARSNYQEEIAGEINGPESIGKHFFGERFNLEDVRNFKPDATIDHLTELKIGGTRIELIPVHGGETHDAMFVHLPDLGVLFVGDFIMPYIGAPFVVEGDFQGLLDAIDIVVQKNPRYMLHGPEPLTRNFSSPA